MSHSTQMKFKYFTAESKTLWQLKADRFHDYPCLNRASAQIQIVDWRGPGPNRNLFCIVSTKAVEKGLFLHHVNNTEHRT